jgi:putative heme-binding domain-containing protein
MPSFGRSLNDDHIRAVVAYLRTLQGKGKTAEVTGDAEHGRALFFGAAGCSSCHTLNGKGGFLGPDLSNYAATHTAAEIRESMVNPNPDQDTRRGVITVVTNAGKKFTGVLRNEDNFSLQMQTSDGNFHFFDKSDLASIERSTKSLMPTNYESKLGKKGMDDLVSFLMKAAPGSARSINNDDDQ